MTSMKRVGRLIAAGLALVASITGAASAQSQVTITGKVTDAQGNGIPGANVVVPSLGVGVGANTNVDGNFTLNLPASQAGKAVIVTARRIGFSPISRTVTLGAGAQTENFQLSMDARRIDDVIVTGVAEATSS